MGVKRKPGLTFHQVFLTVIVFVFSISSFIWVLTHRADEGPAGSVVYTCRQQSLSAKVESADLILTGNVFAVIPSQLGAEVIISPTQIYRGTLPVGGIQIVAQPNTSPSRAVTSEYQELNFTSGDPSYLLFLRQRTDGKYATSQCAGSRLLGEGLTAAETAILGLGHSVNSLDDPASIR